MMGWLVFLAGITVACTVFLGRSMLLGFRGQTAEDYDEEELKFDIREILSGPLVCEGVIYGPFGRVMSRFVAELEGEWSDGKGRLTERFRYQSGEVQEREWMLSVGEQGRITAEADDVVGTGRGRQVGSVVNLNYTIRLLDTAGGHVLKVNDWMYLIENGTIINRSQFRKFGILVAELVATIRPAAVRPEDETNDIKERLAAE